MPSSNIEVVEIGIPGPPGSGVSAAEKATFVTLTAANVFTNTNRVRTSSATAFIAESASATTDRTLVLDTAAKEVELWNGADLRGFSDAGSTETWSIDGATGAAQFDSTASATRFIGESVLLSLPTIDGAGSAITTGVKYDFACPYNFTITEWTLLADTSGSISIELWKDSYANYPATVADLTTGTTGTNNPRIVTATKGQSTTLTNWDTTWTQGELIRVNVASVTTITRVAILLKVTKT
jgi:hypothetical protein